MEKSRTISSPDFGSGERPDGKWSGASSALYVPSALYTNIMNNYQLLYAQARVTATWLPQVPTGTGIETLSSTTRKKPLFNNCIHTKKWAFSYPYLVAAQQGPSSGYYQPYYKKGLTTAINSITKLPALLPFSLASIEEIQRRAWWSMQPKFETEVQLLNFIYELKDFKHLVKNVMQFNWQDFTKKAQKSQKYMANSRGALNNKSTLSDIGKYLNDITRGIASGWLGYAFAWKPLVKDLSEISKLVAATVAAVQEEFRDRGLEVQRTHYSEVINLTSSMTLSGAYSEWMTGARAILLFTATLEYTYSYVMRTGFNMYKKALGLDLTAEVLWNGTPFTFILDYFIPIGKALHTMAADSNVVLNATQYCESVYSESFLGTGINPQHSAIRKFYCPSHNGGKGLTGNETFVPVIGCKDARFHRWVATPNKGSALPKAKTPSSYQMVNLAALIRSFI